MNSSTARVRRAVSQAGDPAWLITDYPLVRSLLGDARLASSHPEPERAPRVSDSVIQGGPMPESPTQAADHARMRRVLGGQFSPQRLAQLRPWMRAVVEDLLHDLVAAPQPADFHRLVSFPLPALVISELFGVPPADRDAMRDWSAEAGDMTDGARSVAGMAKLADYLLPLIKRRLADPGDDVLSALARAHHLEPAGFPLEAAAYLGAGLLFAGHETTVHAIDVSVVLLTTHDDQREKLVRATERLPCAVEEILRLAVPSQTSDPRFRDIRVSGLPRWANDTIEVDGVAIAQGDLVLLDLREANQDACLVGPRPGFDVERSPNIHLTFGYGPHYCVGAALARLELQVLWETLLSRLPTIRLAVPPDDLPIRHNSMSGGFTELPVHW